jgi:hypothetical protein
VPKGRIGSVVALMGLVVVAVLALGAPSGAQYNHHPTCRLIHLVMNPGGTNTAIAEGFRAHSTVTFTIFSDPLPIGTAVSDDQLVATRQFTLPTDFPAGEHEVEAAGVLPDGTPATVRATITVVPAEAGADASDPGSEDLARTGGSTGNLARIAVLLVAAGGALLLASRKRGQRGTTAV